jgi:hypothetical protein
MNLPILFLFLCGRMAKCHNFISNCLSPKVSVLWEDNTTLFQRLENSNPRQQISLLEALCCVCTILGLKRIINGKQTWFEGFNLQSTKKMWYFKLEGQKAWCQELQGRVPNRILNLNAYMHNISTQKKCTTKAPNKMNTMMQNNNRMIAWKIKRNWKLNLKKKNVNQN